MVSGGDHAAGTQCAGAPAPLAMDAGRWLGRLCTCACTLPYDLLATARTAPRRRGPKAAHGAAALLYRRRERRVAGADGAPGGAGQCACRFWSRSTRGHIGVCHRIPPSPPFGSVHVAASAARRGGAGRVAACMHCRPAVCRTRWQARAFALARGRRSRAAAPGRLGPVASALRRPWRATPPRWARGPRAHARTLFLALGMAVGCGTSACSATTCVCATPAATWHGGRNDPGAAVRARAGSAGPPRALVL